MWKNIRLRIRIYIILAGLVFINLAGGGVLVWYTYRMESLLTGIIENNLAAFQTAETLEIALVNQKGFVSYYFLDGNRDWLEQLAKYRQIFEAQLKEAYLHANSASQHEAIDLIDSEYRQYIVKKDRVLELYKNGNRETATQLHRDVRAHFFKVLDLCEDYKKLHQERILQAKTDSHSQATRLRIIGVVAMLIGFLLTILLAFVLVNQILGPVRRLTAEADKEVEVDWSNDEVKALSRSVRGLIQNVDQTQLELEKSRESLLQAEKMALVGKLAAGMAHSIRNPFTSVKMRLFSLSRNLELSNTQKEDFEVISEEIRHIDNIVQNFLEFSRPPKLKMQRISPSAVVDQTIQLLEHRLKSYGVIVGIERKVYLPEVDADPEQLKEVLVNIVVNACEAMEQGGTIVIREYVAAKHSSDMQAVIRIRDNGPGIPESIRDKILQPFFTTKEEGTGLGLSIAKRIIDDHQGRMDIESEEGEGTTFVIMLPVKESIHENNSDH